MQNSLSGVNLSNLVTLNTNQTITGNKTFSSTSNFPVDIAGNSRVSGFSRFGTYNTNSGVSFSDGTTCKSRMYHDSNLIMWSNQNIYFKTGGTSGETGNAGGTTLLYLNGNSQSIGIGTETTANGYSLDINGNVIATSYNATSDRRLKDNIEPMESQWSNILSINPVSFDWKLSGKSDTGFIAQDIHTKYPYLKPDYTGVQDPNSNPEEPIDLSGNPLYYAIDYGRMTPFLWKGVQETMQEIDSLKKENAQLKDLIYGLSERLASLESTR